MGTRVTDVRFIDGISYKSEQFAIHVTLQFAITEDYRAPERDSNEICKVAVREPGTRRLHFQPIGTQTYMCCHLVCCTIERTPLLFWYAYGSRLFVDVFVAIHVTLYIWVILWKRVPLRVAGFRD